MNIGISTYAYFWHLSAERESPWSITDVIDSTANFGADVVQICDFLPLDTMTDAEVADIRSVADDAGVKIELGTRGTGAAHLNRYLDLAEMLDARIVRTMLTSTGARPPLAEVHKSLNTHIARLERADVRIAIETYEQVSTPSAVSVIAQLDCPYIGICSDPANTIAILENPSDVIELVAPYVVNMHVKDFSFQRNAGSNGFALTGAPLGTGLLPYDYMSEMIRPETNGISQIIEHWLPRQESLQRTLAAELEWTRHSLNFLRAHATQPKVAKQ